MRKLEPRIGQTEAEGEQGDFMLRILPPISYVKSFGVVFDIVDVWILIRRRGRDLVVAHGEGERKFCRRIDVS